MEIGIYMHETALKMRVRLVCPERPGNNESEPYSDKERQQADHNVCTTYIEDGASWLFTLAQRNLALLAQMAAVRSLWHVL